MAVEIPIYVDIQGAFDRAVREIPKEMPKLEKVLSRHALSIKIDMKGYSRTVRELLTDTATDANELEFALKRVRKAFDEAVAKGANKTKTSATVNNLAKAYGLLEQRVKGFYNSNNVAAMRLEDTIAKVSYKINDMKSKLSSLSVGSDQYNKINYELQIQRKRLADLTLQQMQYKAGIDASTSAYHKQAGIVKQLTGYFSGLYAVHSLVRFVKQVRDVTGELEYQRVALGHLLQDADFGNELFAKTVEAAKESPFRIGQLVTYTKQLAAYRIEQENLFDTTQRLADISAGLGVDMNRLILAYGQVRAASVLRGQELRQFTEAGIPLVELLAEKFRELGREGTTTADVFKLISERAVPFEYIKEIFEDLTNAGGMFYKMQEEQAKTLKGRWEKLKDAYDQALMSLGDSSTFQSWNDTILNILNGLAKNLNGVVRVVNAASMAWAAYWVTTKSGLSYGVQLTGMFIKEYGAVTTLKFGVAGLTAAFKKLWLAMKSNWVGIAISAVTGLVTLFTTFRNKTKEATEGLSDMQKAIERMKNANKEFEYGKGLISSYEELAKKTDRTSRESERMLDTLNELERAFPELTDKINNDNLTLEERIGIMRDAVNAGHELAVQEAKNRLNTQNEIIRGLEDQEKAAKLAKESTQRRLEEAQTAEKIGVVPIEQRYGPGIYDTAEDLKNKTIEAAKAAKEADDAYEDVAIKLATARREAEQLRKLAFPDDVKNAMAEWQNLLIGASKYTSEGIPKLLFTDKDVQSWDSLGEAIKKLKPQFEEARKTYLGLVNAVKEGGTLVRPELTKDRDAAGDTFAAWQALDALLGGLLSKAQTHGSDKRLSNLKRNISEITNAYKKFLELRKYMSEQRALDEIGVLFPQLKGFEPTFENTIAKIKGLLDNYKGPKDKVYLEMQRAIDTEVSNLSFDDLKKTIDDKLKEVSEDIKRSETARNFYNNILDITGDEGLATNLSIGVYGNIGDDFKDRIKKELVDSLSTLDAESFAGLDDAIRNAFDEGDYEYLVQNLDKVPEKLRETVKRVASDAAKYNADIANNFANLVSKYGSTAQKIATIRAKAENEINKVKTGRDLALKAKNLTPEQIQGINERADELIRALEAQRDLDIFKAGEDYIKFFAEINVMTAEQATKVRTKLRHAYLDAFHDGAISADELHKNLRAIDAQFRKLTEDTGLLGAYLSGGFDKANEKLMEYSYSIDTLAKKMKAGRTLDSDEQNFVTQMLRQFGSSEGLKGIKSYTQLIENKGGLEAAGEAFGAMGEGMSAAAANGPGALAIVDAIFKAVHGTITGIQQIIDQLNEVRSEENKIGDWFKYVSDFDRYTYSGWEKLKSGDAIGATADAVSSWISIFNNIQRDKVKKFDDEIERQSRLLSELGYAYGRLQQAESKALGAEFIANYGSRLSNLQAQVDAYNAQAAAEQAKGKSADSEKVKQFQDSAREALDQIEDMQSEVSNKLLGTDLTSAARDFANAWIEAYKSFGSTTDALKEKFADMIQSMVVESLAARVVQEQLAPIFEMIDTLSKDDSQFSVMDAAAVANKTKETVGTLNVGLTNLMNALSGAGLNIRSMGTGLTGISKDIQGASEESILGLAAGVNTQNYYMSQINANVIRIVSILGGTGASGAASETSPAGGMSAYQTEALSYLGHLPQMQSDMAEVRRLLSEVIKVKGASSTYSVRIS